jgi:hypothetical protein
VFYSSRMDIAILVENISIMNRYLYQQYMQLIN